MLSEQLRYQKNLIYNAPSLLHTCTEAKKKRPKAKRNKQYREKQNVIRPVAVDA
jgi:hypothetical protein